MHIFHSLITPPVLSVVSAGPAPALFRPGTGVPRIVSSSGKYSFLQDEKGAAGKALSLTGQPLWQLQPVYCLKLSVPDNPFHTLSAAFFIQQPLPFIERYHILLLI